MSKQFTSKDIKIIAVACAGGVLEFFEFTIYALFAQYIGMHFFPNQNSFIMLMMSFGVFTLGYFARPLGGIVFGHIGDKYGRKKAFSLTILSMSGTTLLIGCLPTYQTIGITASLMLIALRLIQGFSVGGEIAGATVFTIEHVPIARRGLSVGIVFMGTTLGNLLGGIIGFSLNYILGGDKMVNWGWRVPFILGFLLGILSFLIRRNTLETPIFKEIEQKKLLQIKPFLTLMKNSHRAVIIGICMMSIPSTILGYLLYLPVYLSTFLKFKMAQSFLLNIVGFSILSFGTGIVGYFSDYFNRKSLALIGCFTITVIGYIAFHSHLNG